MLKSIITARASNGVIGNKNGLPWYLPADLKFFKKKTEGHHLIMGRKTFESLPKPLPNRISIVITRDSAYKVPEGCLVASSLDEAFEMAEKAGEEEVFIAGGEQIYRLALEVTDRMYITEVLAEVVGDTWFPPFNTDDWDEISKIPHEADEDNPHPYTFRTLDRKSR